MTDTMTLTGLVATPPRHTTTAEGAAITSFRLASNLRRFDRKIGSWVDAGTNWYTISAYRKLAVNLVGSLNKGDRVIVTGRLRIKEWEDGEKRGTNIEIDADALGHDLRFGTASFARNVHSTPVETLAADEGEGGSRETGAADAAGAADASQGTASALIATPF
jgi:single-strand DNA-binding protein